METNYETNTVNNHNIVRNPKWQEPDQARVVGKVDNPIQWINHYPADSMVCFCNTNPQDCNFSRGALANLQTTGACWLC